MAKTPDEIRDEALKACEGRLTTIYNNVLDFGKVAEKIKKSQFAMMFLGSQISSRTNLSEAEVEEFINGLTETVDWILKQSK